MYCRSILCIALIFSHGILCIFCILDINVHLQYSVYICLRTQTYCKFLSYRNLSQSFMAFSWLNLYRDYIGLYFTYIHFKTGDPINVETCSSGKPFFPDKLSFFRLGSVLAVKWSMIRLVFKSYNFCLACSSKVNHNFEIWLNLCLDLISMKGTDYENAGSPEQAHSKVLDFQPLSRKNWPQKSVKYWFVRSCCCFALFIVDFNVSRVVYIGVIVLFLRIPAFGYSL